MKKIQARVITSKWVMTAQRQYTCHGCGGEFPIPAQSPYWNVKVSTPSGIKALHYCPRCAYAIFAKMRYSKNKGIDLTANSTQYHKLSSAFRAKWELFVEILKAWNSETNPVIKAKLYQRKQELERDFQVTE